MLFARSFRLALLFVIAGALGPVAQATETDQFTIPASRLHDIGPELSRKIVEVIEADRSGKTPEEILAYHAGRNFLASRMSRWVRGFPRAEAPVQFHPSVFASVYRRAFAPVPASFWFNAPTVQVHGYYLGTDKLDHFFQQGHAYSEIVRRKRARGMGLSEAIAAAVAHGVKQEHSYFGTLFSGVYSNADLAANYAGLKFYLNLRQPVAIGERILPPLFEPSTNGWRLRPGVDPALVLEPFFSNHLDESLNPCRYSFSRRSIRSRVQERCASWAGFYADRLQLVAPAGQSFARTWFGEDYGHWLPPGQEISIATVCGAVGSTADTGNAEI